MSLLSGHLPRATAQAWRQRRKACAWESWPGPGLSLPLRAGLETHLEDARIGLSQILPRKVLPGDAEARAGRVEPPQPLVAAAAYLAQKPVCKQHARGPAAGGADGRSGRGRAGGCAGRAVGRRPGSHLSGAAAMAPTARGCDHEWQSGVAAGEGRVAYVSPQVVWLGVTSVAQVLQELGSQMWVEGLWPRHCPGFLAKVAMDVTTDVAARTREVTGVEPASAPAGRAGWTCGDRRERPLQRLGFGKAKPRVAGKRNLTLNREEGASPSRKPPAGS